MKAILFFLFLITPLFGREQPPPLLAAGGGYWHAGQRHSGGLFQLDYRFGNYWFWKVRPQAILIAPDFHALFVGAGIGLELFLTQHLIVIPSFSPGLYYKGSGRDLGYPLEFRSSIELAYQFDNCARLGFQAYHISNASLSSRNPGANALVLYLAIPLCNR